MSRPSIRVSGAMTIDMKYMFQKATMFYANELMSPQLVANLHIHVKYKRLADKNTYGECGPIGEAITPRKFKIDITPSKCKVEVFKTLAHEMVHVKQYAYKELKYQIRSLDKMKWKGKAINEECITYEKLPWEKEAFKREDELFFNFVISDENVYNYFARNIIL
jgi:hypothetical protein